ncbi:hypothetical protein [Archaeoglobus fulgidus]|uniref:Transposase n=2 Tax=Archaeoglobus fulgidus TaxID=2234 RepID=A0A075WCN3_ARCFL|nr:hypothetical protein [Archaeoglobus fulgidus]AIG96959.1 hypothetical protein AFULGI_00001180 [Archaeoglobus fulgidus DSM 8774]KUJ94663.1 MAG: hypothetical protein XD40_0227 [Archaeoglobus fulgidus]KUK06645.1 MAG: Uncharacterized protein XD48_1103 [Archaeoglobus fulgidus]
MYSLVEFDGKRTYQPDIAAIAVDYALSMSYRDSRQRLQRMTESPSHLTIWRRVQELGMEAESEFEYDDFVSADSTKLHAQGKGKLDVKVIAGKSVIVGINESYREMKGEYDVKATIVGDADRDLSCFEERQIDLIHIWREVNYKLWQHGVDLETRKQYVNEVKGILLRLKNSIEKPDLESRIKKTEKALNEFVKEMEEKGGFRGSLKGIWRTFFCLHTRSLRG